MEDNIQIFINALNIISNNPVLNIDDSNKLEGFTPEGYKISVERTFFLGDNSLPAQEISIVIDGCKVYGYHSDFLTIQDLKSINKHFYVTFVIIDRAIAKKQKERKEYFKKDLQI